MAPVPVTVLAVDVESARIRRLLAAGERIVALGTHLMRWFRTSQGRKAATLRIAVKIGNNRTAATIDSHKNLRAMLAATWQGGRLAGQPGDAAT